MAKRNDPPTPALSADAVARFGARLDALGPFVAAADDSGVTVTWAAPTGLPDLGFRVAVEFATESDAGRRDLDEPLFALWDRFRAGLDRHAAFFRQEVLALYRGHQPHLPDAGEFPADLPDAAVLARVRGTIKVERHEERGHVDYWLDVSFAAAWDGEHSWDYDYDEVRDAFEGGDSC